MTDIFKFYHSEFNPPGLSGAVGGKVSEYELVELTNELFSPVDMSVANSPFFQYRKFWIKQVSGSYSSLYLEMSNLEYPSRYGLTSGSGNDSLLSPTGDPGSLIFQTGIDASIDLQSGNSGDSFPIWIRQEIRSGENIDALTSLTFRLIE